VPQGAGYCVKTVIVDQGATIAGDVSGTVEEKGRRRMNWRFDPIIIAVAVGLAATVLFGAWWLWWRLPKRQADRLKLTIRDAKARADLEDNLRKTISQLLGGAAVLIGAGFAYLQFTAQQRAAHDLLISNQVAKGFELLGNKDNQIQQRLGGIYALEGVMNTSEQYHQPVLEALSAFVRDGTQTAVGDKPPATDIQAAVTVIGRRAAIGSGDPDFSGANLQKADLSLADLRHADLRGSNLSGAFMYGADLRDAYLFKANLSGTLLSTDMRSIPPRRAALIGANLTDATLTKANLTDADLTGATLDGADLIGATVSQAQLNSACGTDVSLDPDLTIKPCPN
jgi:hypothetical protein